MKSNKKLFIAVTIAFLLTALPAYALESLVPECARGTGVPSLMCFLTLLMNVAEWILGLTGSLALLYFVYGGFLFLTSRGNTEQITKGKTVLTHAVIGIIIIFGAYFAVDFLSKIVLQATVPKTPEGALIEEGAKKEIVVPLSTCYCAGPNSTFDQKNGNNLTTADCTAFQQSKGTGWVCGLNKLPEGNLPTTSQGQAKSCSCICNNGSIKIISSTPAADGTYNLEKNCAATCAFQRSTMKSCN